MRSGRNKAMLVYREQYRRRGCDVLLSIPPGAARVAARLALSRMAKALGLYSASTYELDVGGMDWGRLAETGGAIRHLNGDDE